MSGCGATLVFIRRLVAVAALMPLAVSAPSAAIASDSANDYTSTSPTSERVLAPSIDPQTWDEAYYGPLEHIDSRAPKTKTEKLSVISFSSDPQELLPGQFMVAKDQSGFSTSASPAAFDPYTFDYDSVTWGACGISSDDLKIIRTFPRASRSSNWSGGYAYLNCGQYDGDGFGFNHILKRHATDWANKAAYIGSAQWRHAADFGMYGALGYPEFIRYNSVKNTYCLNRWIYVNYKNQTVNKFKATVVIGATGRRIITAYPSKSWCSATDSVVIYDTRP